MRDFRDAKAMAQTLRDVIKPKAELTHSESLELIAKVLGCQNWNVLAAALQSAGDPVQSARFTVGDHRSPRRFGWMPLSSTATWASTSSRSMGS